MSKESLLQNKGLRNSFRFQNYLTPAVLLGLILLLGISLRFYDLGAESYWTDEMYTVVEGQQSLLQVITSGRLDQPPAYYLPFHFWVQIFGLTEVSTRSFSTLAGIGSIVLIYLIGKELFGKQVGLISAFLMTISVYQIYYSQETRFYGFFEFMTLLSFLFFILALKSKKTLHFTLYFIASVLMIYSHTYGVFIIVAQNLFFFLRGKKYGNMIVIWLIIQLLILFAVLPSFYLLFFGVNGIGGAITSNLTGPNNTPSFLEPLHTLYRFILPARATYGQEIIFGSYVAATVLFLTGVGILVIRQGWTGWAVIWKELTADLREVWEMTDAIILLICWLFCPIILPFLSSNILSGSLYTERYMISAAPALYLLLALGIFSLRKLVPVIISLGVLLILILPGLGLYYVEDIKEQWKEAATFVGEYSKPDDIVIFAPLSQVGVKDDAFNWYYQGTLQGCGLSGELIDPTEISNALEQCIYRHDRFWVILPYYPASTDPEIVRYRSFFLNPNQTDMRKIKENQFVGISVYLFESTK